MREFLVAHRLARPGTRPEWTPALALAALVAALHVSVLAGRLSARLTPGRQTIVAWPMPVRVPIASPNQADRSPSNPVCSYCAGQLELTFGMAVLTLAAWLQVMRANGSHGR